MFIATSLDGFIARRDGGIDWLAIVEAPGEDYGYANDDTNQLTADVHSWLNERSFSRARHEWSHER